MSTRRVDIAYLLAAFSFFFVSGLHRFYLGKPGTGLLWLCTGGLFGIGTIYDLITLPSQVDDFNNRQLLLKAAVSGQNRRLPPAPPLESQILRLAQKHNGRLSVSIASAELGKPISEVEKKLDDMVRGGHASMEVTDEGTISYIFPELAGL